MHSLLPHLSTIRHLSKTGIYKVRQALAVGNLREALEDVLTVARVARHWQNSNGSIIEQLVGAAISDLACQEVCRLVANKGLTAADLRRVQECLEALHPAGCPALDIESERLSLIDTIQRVFTQGGPGGGHIVPRQWAHITRGLGGWMGSLRPEFFGDKGVLAAASLVHAGRDGTLAMGKAYYDRVAEWSKLTPYQQNDEANPDEMVAQWTLQGRFRYQTPLHDPSELDQGFRTGLPQPLRI